MNPFVNLTSPLYLASSSPRRQAILRDLGVPFSLVTSAVEEKADPGWGPHERAVRLASAKAQAGARGVVEGLVLGADTVVVMDGSILGKPRDRDEATEMLELLGGGTHEVITGLALIHRPSGRMLTDCARTLVHMREIEPEEIESYSRSEEPMDKAGAYGIQGVAGVLVSGIEGCYFNVVGLPVFLWARMMREMAQGL